MATPTSSNISAVHFLALVAYNQEAVSAAIDVAIKDAERQYGSRVNFTYSLLWNPMYACDVFEGMVADYVARYHYNGTPESQNTSLVILATGCSQAEYTAAELARGNFLLTIYAAEIFPVDVRICFQNGTSQS